MRFYSLNAVFPIYRGLVASTQFASLRRSGGVPLGLADRFVLGLVELQELLARFLQVADWMCIGPARQVERLGGSRPRLVGQRGAVVLVIVLNLFDKLALLRPAR